MNVGSNFTTMTARKRSQSGDFDSDNVPLTKRIALLSVDGSSPLDEECVHTSHQMLNNNYAPSCYTVSQPVDTPWQQQSVLPPNADQPCVQNEHPSVSSSSVGAACALQNGASSSDLDDLCEKMGLSLLASGKYSPELDSQANPEYYDINFVLFHAHLQRLHRRGVLCPF